VLTLLARGYSSQQIAKQIFLSVITYRSRFADKLGLRTRVTSFALPYKWASWLRKGWKPKNPAGAGKKSALFCQGNPRRHPVFLVIFPTPRRSWQRYCGCQNAFIAKTREATDRSAGTAKKGYPVSVATKAPFDPKTCLAKVAKTTVGYRESETIFSQGDRADGVFYIQKGKVKLSVISNSGREAVVAILDGGDFLGEECLTDRPLRLSSAVALSECSVLRVDRFVMMRLLHDEPAFSEIFASYLISRTARIEADLVDLLFDSSEKRLARMLLLLANFGKESTPDTVIARISQETLANMIGTTRSRVSFFMNKFRKLGLIGYSKAGNRKIEVHSSLLNIVLHD
jgi:CRP/FNR family cyclic AMP-dependent transcriptional regulator